jgi:hypothetical protein
MSIIVLMISQPKKEPIGACNMVAGTSMESYFIFCNDF